MPTSTDCIYFRKYANANYFRKYANANNFRKYTNANFFRKYANANHFRNYANANAMSCSLCTFPTCPTSSMPCPTLLPCPTLIPCPTADCGQNFCCQDHLNRWVGLPLTARWHCQAKTFAVKMVLSAKSLTYCDKWVWLSTKSCEIRKGDECWKYQQRICENLNFTQFKHPIVWSF